MTFVTRAALVFPAVAALAADTRAVVPLTRQPYLQSPGQDKVTIMWRTGTAVQQAVDYRLQGTSTGWTTVQSVSTTSHEVTITGLLPGQKYDYQISENGIVAASNPGYTFRTDPGRQHVNFSFFATGDIGSDGQNGHQAATRARILQVDPVADFGILLGDIIYPSGRSINYDARLMTPWAELLRNTPVWPVLGNHDWGSDPQTNFCREWSLPNNEHYYSFDYGNAHFIALDSRTGSWYDEANQMTFLEHDLATPRNALWTFVFFHHPMLTCTYKENQPDMAAVAWPLFQEYGVDVVFTGHAHTFERSFPLIDGNPVDKAQDPYYVDPQGPIYVVSGCGGKVQMNNPTTLCGPTAKFVDEKKLFTQVFVRDHYLLIVTIDTVTGGVLDVAMITKSQTTASVSLPPSPLHLQQNFPNPFNPSTTIPFDLAQGARVRLAIYGADGRWVTNLVDQSLGAGQHRAIWHGVDHAGLRVPSGVYVARLSGSGESQGIKMVIVQ
jgi:predicted phosphodiesterase